MNNRIDTVLVSRTYTFLCDCTLAKFIEESLVHFLLLLEPKK